MNLEYRSVLAFRHQHHLPYFFDQSDIYVICRLSPITYDIKICNDELSHCEWFPVSQLAFDEDANPLTKCVSNLILTGLKNGFDQIDITYDEMPSIYDGITYKLYHR